MKNIYIYITLIGLLTAACGTSVNKGESFEKTMKLDFEGVINEDDELTFILDKSVDLAVHFSKGKFSENTYTITTKEYQKDNEPVVISLSSENEGTYEFSMKLQDATEGMEVNFSTDDKVLKIPSLKVREKWKQYIIPLGVLLALLIVLVVLQVKKYLQKTKPKFDHGYLEIFDPKEMQVDLEGKHKINLAKLSGYNHLRCFIYCNTDTVMDGDEEDLEKIPNIEIDQDLQLMINSKITESSITKLTFGDKIAVKDNENKKIIELTINE